MAIIKRGGTRQIRPNFSEEELQSSSWRKGYKVPSDEFELSDNTLDALQWLRDFLNTEIDPNSTARSPEHNGKIGSYPSSMHYWDGSKMIRAIDFHIDDVDMFNVLYWDIVNKGKIYQTLRKRFGLSIGLYNNFFHIDDGQGSGVGKSSKKMDEHGNFGFWNKASKKKASTKVFTILSKLAKSQYLSPQKPENK